MRQCDSRTMNRVARLFAGVCCVAIAGPAVAGAQATPIALTGGVVYPVSGPPIAREC